MLLYLRNVGDIMEFYQDLWNKTRDKLSTSFAEQTFNEVFGEVKKVVKEENTETFPYLVRIETDVLNVRAGASEQSKITTQVKKGQVYTIVDRNGDWGKLKSGAGWISLSYAKKV